jgi:polar amino acid transport system permease protein
MGYALNFNLIWRHFDKLWGGLLLSLELAVISIAIGVVIGLVLAVWYVSAGRVVRGVIAAYVEFIRNVPLLLLIFFCYFGLPEMGIYFLDKTQSFVLTLSLYAGAYMCEVFRAGLASIPRQYMEAAKAIGLTPWQRLLHVRLPTMLRITLPALSNTFISLFKDTSVASVISVPELTYGAQWINFNTFRIVEVYLVVTAMYLVTGYALLFALRLVEYRFRAAR